MSKSTKSLRPCPRLSVFFDARFTRTTHHDGISRYGSCLLSALLRAVEGTEIDVTVIISDQAQLACFPNVRGLS